MFRRTIALLLILMLLFTAVACDKKEAPKEEPAKEEPAEEPTAEEPAKEEPAEEPTKEPVTREVSPMKAGEYLVESQGNSPMKVKVVLEEKGIKSVEVVEHTETEGLADAALKEIPENIVREQSVGIDTISGATHTSEGIINAVKDAISQAGGKVEEFDIAPEKGGAEEVERPVLGTVELPENWDMTYDVVVVGGGFAGLAAAYSAQTHGAKTVLIDKMPVLGGNSQINGGVYASYTSKIADKLYEDLGLTPDTVEKHIEDTIAGGDYMSDEKLVNNFVKGSPFILDMLLDNGLEVRPSITRPGGHYGYRTYTTINGVGADIVAVQKKMLEGTDAEVLLNTKMTQIYRQRDGEHKVVGIQVETNEGIKTIKAEKAVILASGGFSGNVEMRSKHVPTLTADLPTTNHVGATGETIPMAQEIGANTTQMSYIQLYPFANPNNGVLDAYAVIPFSGPSSGVVYVDVEGKRYVNEGERRDVCAKAAQDSGGFPTFCIFGQEIVDKGGFISDSQLENGIKDDRIFKADSLEELAEMINAHTYQDNSVNMKPEDLVATIEQHNAYVENGEDPDFHKVIDKGVMLKIEEGPYYCVPQWPSVHHTMGGLTINEYTQVQDVWGEVIPGLYAAGEVTGGVHGTNRLGSNAIPDAAVHGYIAGQHAADGTLPEFLE